MCCESRANRRKVASITRENEELIHRHTLPSPISFSSLSLSLSLTFVFCLVLFPDLSHTQLRYPRRPARRLHRQLGDFRMPIHRRLLPRSNAVL